MFPGVLTVLLPATIFLNIFPVDASSCEVTYRGGGGVIRCIKTEVSLSGLDRTHLVLKYKCDGEEDVYENCPYDSRKVTFFEIKDCALTPDTFNFCNDYQIVSYSKLPGNYKNVVLRNGTFGMQHSVSQILLSGNGIRTVEPGAFGCLSNLGYVDLSNNDIEELPDDAFRCLLNLRHLDLSKNRLKMVPKCLRDHRYLRSLRLSDNFITVFPETALHENVRLQVLDLDRNAIQKFCPSEISQLDDLIYLFFRGNNITSLTNECFAKQKSLLWLNIGMNIGLVLENDVFSGLNELQKLYIDGCGLSIGVEGSKMFSNCTRLWELHLQHNQLREIHSDLFRNLDALHHLDLSFNSISLLHNGSFPNHLAYLDLSNNFLNEIKTGEFSGMYMLQILNISNNHITYVAENAFDDLWFIGTLNIANNNISPWTVQSSVPMHAFENIFGNLERLEMLDMSNITSRDFNLSFSKENKNIKYLDVSFNVGLRLDENSLKNLKNVRTFISRGTNAESLYHLFTHNTGLEEINMSLNKLQTINLSEMMTARNLRKVDLSWNNINRVDSFLFEISKLSKLEYLNLSHNALQDIRFDFFLSENRRLKVLDISNNRLLLIQWRYLNFIDNLWASNNPLRQLFLSELETTSFQTVHLEDCKIQKVHLHSKLEIVNFTNSVTTVLFMARNPVVCDCHAFQLYEYVKHQCINRRFLFDRLTCRCPAELEGRKIENLLPVDFSCEVRRSCPETCRCLKRAQNHTVAVNCSRRYLGRLPEDIPVNTTLLDVSYNRIMSLESLKSSIWDNLTEIRAEGNLISSLEFEVPKSVKIFLLHSNRLTKLPERHASITRRDLHITLSENPWPCGCESLNLKYFLSERVAQILDASEVRCAPSTNSTSNLILLEMKEQDLCPNISEFRSANTKI